MAAAGADAEQIAGEAIAVWQAIHSAMAPVIGQRGSAALHHRCLHVARATYPWLDPACEAAAAHDSMVLAFLELLTTLIGEALTARLLQGVGDRPCDDISSQEPLR